MKTDPTWVSDKRIREIKHGSDDVMQSEALALAGEVRERRRAAEDEGWQPIETAPKDGRHIIVADMTPGRGGFGYCDTSDPKNPQPWTAVVHWWSHPGEEGFYLSSGGADERAITGITHWMPITRAK